MAESRLETVDMFINMGPQHPSTHGVFRMVLTIDGEQIVDMKPHIGYLHRGVEKLAEGLRYREVTVLLDRTDYLAALNNELPYVMALEKLLDVKVPERAEYIRVLVCELNRIASHLMFYGAFGADAGATTPFMYAFRDREEIQHFFEAVTGGRLMHNYFRVGGVRYDLPEDWRERLTKLIPHLRKGIVDCERLLSDNEIFLNRTIGVGQISAADAIDYGLTGPNLRACGVRLDLRRDQPYSVYPKLEFDVPTRSRGDCYDRYLLRVEEMRQSLRIVEQCLEQMPDGPSLGEVPRVIRPKEGEVYVGTENPRGEYGIYLVSRGGDYPYRVKVRAPSFCNLMALNEMMRGCYIADCVLILGSIDIVLGEVDR
ncbi:MAG: NADH-quinone oxidoreductase subunit D [Chloroflexi bacterium]|nr:NADH-quinone oxidoreductase subunit D [Chloroflexota bacterium]